VAPREFLTSNGLATAVRAARRIAATSSTRSRIVCFTSAPG